MSKLPLIFGASLEEFLEFHSPELADSLKSLDKSDPGHAAKIKKGWRDDLKDFLETKAAPLLTRIQVLNPSKMHHHWELWEETSEELEASLDELFRVWRDELKKSCRGNS